MDLYLIRHGDAAGVAGAYLSGNDDPPLTPQGRRQAEYAGERLSGMGFAALYCGALLRNIETAEIIARRTGLRPVMIPGLFEISGNIAAWTPEEARTRFPIIQEAAPWPPLQRDRIETRAEAEVRAKAVCDWLVKEHAGQDARIGVVSHGHFMGLMLGCLLEMNSSDYNRFSAGNCCLHWMEVTPERAKLRAANDQEHIPHGERT